MWSRLSSRVGGHRTSSSLVLLASRSSSTIMSSSSSSRTTTRTRTTMKCGVWSNHHGLSQQPRYMSSGGSHTMVSTSLKSYDESETSSMCQTKWTPQLTKIVATIGPTSEQLDVLQQVVSSGMRIMRLNFSHATTEEVELRTNNLKQCQGHHGKGLEDGVEASANTMNVRAVLLDTRGPEIRCGKLQNDHSGKETITLYKDSVVKLHTDDVWKDHGGTATDLYIDYTKLHQSLKEGNKVLLDDGAIVLTVTDVEDDKEFHGIVTCTVDNTGSLRSRAGVNLPGCATDLPAMSEKDRIDILYGMTKDVDYVAASFVQNAEGVREIKRYMKECAKELGWEPNAPLPLLISKIESVSACQNFQEILEESDGIMVARGDLGVEIPIQQVTNAQKEMVRACNDVGKPVIVATQMLESMAKQPRPTRAEVADVTNAVYDGADAVMLSGETAKGHYPVESVKMMNDIIFSAEAFAQSRPDLAYNHPIQPTTSTKEHKSREESLAKAAVAAAFKRSAKAILVLPNVQYTSGFYHLPRLIAAQRPNVPIVTFCPSAKVAKQLILHRAIHPIVGRLGGVSIPKRPSRAMTCAQQMGFVTSGDDVVIVGMEPGGDTTNDEEPFATLRVATIP